ncbi:MAG: glycosyltransferase family 2 protein [Kiritimatiellae bacterium]|nr:glycosyltransferase family 2 protein [Kiritimatiellia bacterium]
MKTSGQYSVSIVIPVMNAAKFLPPLFAALASQKPSPPDEIILVDSCSTDGTPAAAGQSPVNTRVIPIKNFSHGGARNMGARAARGDIVVLLTQDALPQNDRWLFNLLAPFSDGGVGAVFSRQIPREDAPPTERFFLQYHFPPGRAARYLRPPQGVLTFQDVFFSNVSAAIRRPLLIKHPFDETLIMSEDQQFARDLLNAGLAVVYQPESIALHSHRYSLAMAFRRYFDSIYSLTLIFPMQDLRVSAAMGRRYLRREFAYILRRHPLYFPYYCLYNMAKAAGAFLGHFGARLPRRLARALSLHRYYWDRPPAAAFVPEKTP